MATSKAAATTSSTERTSQIQMNLDYAKKVANKVAAAGKDRRRKELQRRLDELDALPVVHQADVALRDDLMREVRAQLKQLEDECPF